LTAGKATSQVSGFELLDNFSTKLPFIGSAGPDHVLLEAPFDSNTETMTLAMGPGDDVVDTDPGYEAGHVAVDVDGGAGNDQANLYGPTDRCHDVEDMTGCETVY
jgi:hypothetical protein